VSEIVALVIVAAFAALSVEQRPTAANAAETAGMGTAVVFVARGRPSAQVNAAAIAKQATAVDYAAIGRPNRAHRQTASNAAATASTTIAAGHVAFSIQ